MALTHPLEQYVCGSDEQSLDILPSYHSRWGTRSSSDVFATLTSSETIAWRSLYKDLDVLFDELEHEFAKTSPGAQRPSYEQPFAGLHDEPSIKPHLWVREKIDLGRYLPIELPCRSPMAALSEPCPSLESDRDGSSNRSNDGDVIIQNRPPTTASTASSTSVQQGDPPIYAHIRQVLSSDPILAEGVISAIEILPPHKRNLLIETETTDDNEGLNGSSSDHSPSYGGTSKRRCTSDHNPKKDGEGEHPDDGQGVGGGHGDGDQGKGGDRSLSSSAKRQKTNKRRRWICPFDLAYHEIRENTHFGHCSPGNMFHKYLWKAHLIKHHSPKAKCGDRKAEPNERFYMGQETLDAALKAIDAHEGKPRGIEGIRHCLDLFVKVWYIIFPKDQFPQFKKPLSAFHPEDGEMINLKMHLVDQARILVGTIHDVKAKKAVDAKMIASKDDYRPTAADNDEVLSQAIAIALLKSSDPKESARWLANASPDTIESAGRGYRAQSVAQSVTIPSEDEAETESHGTLTQSITMADPSPIAPAIHIIPVPIYPNGTHFETLPFPNQVHSGTQMGYLTLPPGFYVINTSAGASMDLSMMSPGLDSPLHFPQSNTVSQQPVSWDPSTQLGSQGISSQTIQGGPSAQQEFSL